MKPHFFLAGHKNWLIYWPTYNPVPEGIGRVMLNTAMIRMVAMRKYWERK